MGVAVGTGVLVGEGVGVEVGVAVEVAVGASVGVALADRVSTDCCRIAAEVGATTRVLWFNLPGISIQA